MIEKQKSKELLTRSIRAAIEAGQAVNEVYQEKNIEVETKKDETPLTLADRKSHEIIMTHLSKTDYPVLSEEGKDVPYEERNKWDYFWLVDPLDGTKEFLKKNGEFTVNIALVYHGEPILGVIFAPYVNELFFGASQLGAYKVIGSGKNQIKFQNIDDLMSQGQRLPLREEHKKLVVVASRSHMNDDTQAYIDSLTEKHGDAEFVSKGSSLKICMVAEGKADVYPRFAPTMEWDTAAGHAVALAAGVPITQTDEKTPLLYNKQNLTNPYFIVKAGSL